MMTRTGSRAIVTAKSANAGLYAVNAQPKNVSTVILEGIQPFDLTIFQPAVFFSFSLFISLKIFVKVTSAF